MESIRAPLVGTAAARMAPATLPLAPLALGVGGVASGLRLGGRWISASRLRTLLDELEAGGIRWLDLEAYETHSWSSEEPTALLCLEDPTAEFLGSIWPLLREREIRPLLLLRTAWVGRRVRRDPPLPGRGVSLLSWSELRPLLASGAAFGTRGHFGLDPRRHPMEMVFGDLVRSRRELERRLGIACRVLAYPGGSVDEASRDLALRAGFELGLAEKNAAEGLDPLALPLRRLQRGDQVEGLLRASRGDRSRRATSWINRVLGGRPASSAARRPSPRHPSDSGAA